jgi:HSP20 family protein
MRLVQERWNPWRDLARLQHDVQRLAQHSRPPSAEYPLINVYQNAEEVVLTSEAPGLDPATIDLEVAAELVTVRGRRPVWAPEPGQPEAVEFSRAVKLPFPVDSQSAEAAYERGVLTVRLKRPVSQQSRKVPVAAG